MGLQAWIRRVDLRIAVERHDEALDALKRAALDDETGLLESDPPETLTGASSLVRAFAALNFSAGIDERGDITDLEFVGHSFTCGDQLFGALAPFIDSGGLIEMAYEGDGEYPGDLVVRHSFDAGDRQVHELYEDDDQLFELDGRLEGSAPTAVRELESELVRAVEKNLVRTVERLVLEEGADPNADSGTRGPAFFAAIREDRPRLVRFFLENGADVEAKAGSITPLMCACLEGASIETLEILIAFGADAGAEDANGDTAMDLARRSEHDRAVRLLRRALAPTSEPGDPPPAIRVPPDEEADDLARELCDAVDRSDLEAARALVDAGADPERSLERRPRLATHGEFEALLTGGSALFRAIGEDHAELVDYFLDRGCDASQAPENLTPLMYGCLTGSSLQIIERLSAGTDVDATTPYDGSTALVMAVKVGHLDAVEYLLRSGARVPRRSDWADRPAKGQGTGRDGPVEEVELLTTIPSAPLVRLASLDESAEGLRMLELLLAKGADPNETDEYRQTALFAPYSVDDYEDGYCSQTELLLAHGGEINHLDEENQTPLDAAQEALDMDSLKAERLLELLRSRGGKSGSEMQTAAANP